MLQSYYHCVLKLKGVYGACQIISHPKSGNLRSSESAVLSLEWCMFSRKGVSSDLLQLKGRWWLSCLIFQNLISIHPSVARVSLPQLCLVSWRPHPLWLSVFRGKCFVFCQGGGTGWEGRWGSLLLLVQSFNTSVRFPASLRACPSHVLRVWEAEGACSLCWVPLQLLAFSLLWTVSQIYMLMLCSFQNSSSLHCYCSSMFSVTLCD